MEKLKPLFGIGVSAVLAILLYGQLDSNMEPWKYYLILAAVIFFCVAVVGGVMTLVRGFKK